MQIPDRLRNSLPPRLRQVLLADARKELLNSLDTALLLFDKQMILLGSDQQVSVVSTSADDLASAARQLLPDVGRDFHLSLLLSPAEFVTTSQVMPGVSGDNLASAVALQVDSLLPANEQPLALAVNAGSAGRSEVVRSERGDEHIALWMRQARLDSLFAAFNEQGLFLAAVRPRVLAIPSDEAETRILDESAAGITAVAMTHGMITQWLQVDAVDLEQKAFAEQWQQELKSHPTAQRVELRSAADYQPGQPGQPGQAGHSGAELTANTPYHFFPAGALQARRRIQRGQRLLAAAAAVVGVMLLSAIPFLAQTLQLRSAQAELADSRALAADARADQQAVVAFENEWGAIDDFPDQDIRQAMFTLQEALVPDQLTALEVSEGLISIEGTSNDPQAILQRLEQDPLFTEVVFARATNNTRYYIDLRLSPVNFEGYMRRYFPDD